MVFDEERCRPRTLPSSKNLDLGSVVQAVAVRFRFGAEADIEAAD
jgi:hypothetical protein